MKIVLGFVIFFVLVITTTIHGSLSLQDALLKVSNSIDKRSNYGSNKKLVDQDSNADRVTVFTQDDIQKFDNIYTLLNTASGVVVDEGYFGKNYINVRSSNSALHNNRLQLLVNGFRVNDSLSQDFMIRSIPKSSIQKIELIRGPVSALYGSGAYSGIINIITYQSNKYDKNIVKVTHGTAGQNGATLRLNMNGKQVQSMFSFDVSRADGTDRNLITRTPLKIVDSIPDKNNRPRLTPITIPTRSQQYMQDDENKSFLGFLSYQDFKFTMGYSDIHSNRSYSNLNQLRFRVGPRNVVIPANSQIKEDSLYRMKFIGLNWDKNVSNKLNIKLNGKFQDSFSSIFSFDNILGDSYSESNEKQLEMQFSYSASTNWDLVFGINKDWNSFSQYIEIPRPIAGLVNHYNVSPTKESLFGSYLQLSHNYNDRVKVVISGRYDTHKLLKSSKSPKLAISYKIKNEEYLKLTWGRAFRYPNAIDLFQVSNQRLDPRFEQQISKEVTWSKKYNSESSLSITLFDVRHLHNRSEIRQIGINASSSSRTTGLEAEFKSHLSKSSKYYINLTLLDSVDDGNAQQAADLSEMISVGVDYSFNNSWKLFLDSKFTGARGGSFDRSISGFGGYTLHNVSIQKKLNSNRSVDLKVSNLGDKKYPTAIVEVIGFKIPTPTKGRRVTVSYKIKF